VEISAKALTLKWCTHLGVILLPTAGICEPRDSRGCRSRNSWLRCRRPPSCQEEFNQQGDICILQAYEYSWFYHQTHYL